MTTKAVLKLLEENRKTVQSLNSDKMDTDNRSTSEIVESILEQEKWKGQRASKLDALRFREVPVAGPK